MDSSEAKTKEFTAGAALRIYGTGLDLDGITRELGISPDHQHRRGENDPRKRPYSHDMWSLASPAGEDQDLEVHLVWLSERFLSRQAFILSLKNKFQVDIHCWKNCNTEQSSLILSSHTLRIFTELNLDLNVSLLCIPPETTPQGPAVTTTG